MMGVFVQLNETSPQRNSHPVGYVIQENGCWDWVGAIGVGGYGIWDADGGRLAHRTLYIRAKGAIPTGLQLDHLCRNPSCVNPDHLEPVTPRENTRRSNGISGINSRKTHCLNGHPFDDTNTYVPKKGGRYCKQCALVRQRARAKRMRGVV